MKTRFTWLGIIAICIFCLCGIFVSCNKNEVNDIVIYRGQVVYINTTNPFPDLTVKVTNGKDTHCQTQTDGGGNFSLKVRVNEIDGSYYLLAGDETCIPKQVSLGGYGQAEIDLGVIEVEGPALPTVKTTPVTKITADGATLGGEVMTDGRMAVTARGICYGTNPDPVIDGLHSTDGSGLGAFITTLKDLEHNTIYYARAYATNRKGTAYGEQVKFTTELGVPIVITDSVYRITAHSAKCKGHVESDGGYAVTKKGTCWSRQPEPTVDDECTNDGSGIGEFTSTLNNLLENTTYYVRTYATNATSTVYGEQITVKTLNGLPTVTTAEVTNIGSVNATCGGNVTDDGTLTVTARGVCYGTNQYPTTAGLHTVDGEGKGEFISNLTELKNNTTYYVRAYATNKAGTYYGEQRKFKTEDGLPSVIMSEIGEPTMNSVVCKGNVTGDGGVTVTERGFCYSTVPYPTKEDSYIAVGSGTGEFTGSLTGLTENTTYYVRAYAGNSSVIVYSDNQLSVKTKNGIAVVNLENLSNITAISATGQVTVIDAGGATLKSCGICWATHQYPTVQDSKTTASGKELNTTYTCNLTELQPNTTYYVRAFATTDFAISYSKQMTITTAKQTE